MTGLIAAGDDCAARAVLAAGEPPAPTACIDAHERAALQRAAAALPLGAEVVRAWSSLVADVQATLDPVSAARLSDRALLCGAPALLRAHAWLRGAARVELEDLALARLLLARRLPADRHAHLDEAIDRKGRSRAPVRGPAAGSGVAGAPGAGPGRARTGEPGSATQRRSAELPLPASSDACGVDVGALLRAFEGEWTRGRAGRRGDPAGAPRGQRRLRALDELLDADPVESWLYALGRWPDAPRTWERQRRGAGALVLLRDVSASMEGRAGAWAGEILAALIHSARRLGLRVGLIEFDHEAVCLRERGRFFQRGYAGLLAAAARRRAGGRTSYEAPLRAALDELSRVPRRERHVLLLTDGLPVAGDPDVRAERARARRLGVRVHSLFIGAGAYPGVLDRLSADTVGLRFRSRPAGPGRIRVEPRISSPELERCTKV
jgi:Mg-chelatase subunit ChlD